jgi:hypothetical protein
MKSIAALTFCFRKLPNYFNLWIKSVENNPSIDFILVTTDQTEFKLPKNLKVINQSFEDTLAKVQKCFDFQLNIKDPYKLNDLRPAFGYIFSEWFTGYDFWGSIDLDVVLGDLRAFLTEEVLEGNDKVLTRDHFYLYRNTEEVNKRFMLPVYGKEEFYRKVFTDSRVYCFGERKPWGMYTIYKNFGFPMYDQPIVADIEYKYFKFHVINDTVIHVKRCMFAWENSKLYRYCLVNNQIEKHEYMYMHLQKRPMELCFDLADNYLIVPNKFLPYHNITKADIKRYSKNKLIYLYRVKQMYYRLLNPAKDLFFNGE